MVADSGNRGLIIWPIAQRMFASKVMIQTRPRWTGGRVIPKLPVLPWAESDRPPSINFGRIDKPPIAASYLPSNFGLCGVNALSVRASGIKVEYYGNPNVKRTPSVIHEIKPQPATLDIIAGISKDNVGNVLANCDISLFRVDYDSGKNIVYTFVSSVHSDSNGFYEFNVNGMSSYMVVALNGSVGGVTQNNLIGVNA